MIYANDVNFKPNFKSANCGVSWWKISFTKSPRNGNFSVHIWKIYILGSLVKDVPHLSYLPKAYNPVTRNYENMSLIKRSWLPALKNGSSRTAIQFSGVLSAYKWIKSRNLSNKKQNQKQNYRTAWLALKRYYVGFQLNYRATWAITANATGKMVNFIVNKILNKLFTIYLDSQYSYTVRNRECESFRVVSLIVFALIRTWNVNASSPIQYDSQRFWKLFYVAEAQLHAGRRLLIFHRVGIVS